MKDLLCNEFVNDILRHLIYSYSSEAWRCRMYCVREWNQFAKAQPLHSISCYITETTLRVYKRNWWLCRSAHDIQYTVWCRYDNKAVDRQRKLIKGLIHPVIGSFVEAPSVQPSISHIALLLPSHHVSTFPSNVHNHAKCHTICRMQRIQWLGLRVDIWGVMCSVWSLPRKNYTFFTGVNATA
jgi:hypothetical protein